LLEGNDSFFKFKKKESLLLWRMINFTTNQKGSLALLKVQQRALERGAIVSLPTTDNCRYDAIIDQGGRTSRVQIKYANRTGGEGEGAVSVELTSSHRSGKLSSDCYTAEEIDALVLYVPRIDKILWFGPEIFAGRHVLYIRLEPSKNGQKKGCLFAQDYIW